MKFVKPPLSYRQQVDLLISRGMVVADEAALLRHLESVGYYRLCAYWYPFKQPDDSFASGTAFKTVWSRYVFDRQFRLIVMDAIERVEVASRTALVTELVMRHGALVAPDAELHPKHLCASRQIVESGVGDQADGARHHERS